MIVDKLVNIDKYIQIPFEAREFVKKLNPDIPCGRYTLSETDYVNVETYKTKNHGNCFFEAHKQYADIQILLSGEERLDYADIDKLDLKSEYDKNRDIMFFENTVRESCSVILDGTNFVMLLPNEAHRPQMTSSDNPLDVKKVVVKIKI